MLVMALQLIASGLNSAYTAFLEKGGGNITVIQKNAADMILSQVEEGDVEALRKVSGVEEVSSVVVAVAQMPDMPYFIIFGLNPNEFEIKQYKVIAGRGLKSGDAKKMIIGKGSYDTLRLGVGKKIKVLESEFEIVGIYETGEPWQDGGGVVNIKDAQEFLGIEDRVTWVSLKARDVEATEKRIDRRFPSLQATKSSEMAATMQDYQMINSIASMISFIALIVGGIAVMNTMVMSVVERTREIGVLRALGWGKLRIVVMIMKESVLIALIGAFFGTVLGYAGVMVLEEVSPIPLSFPFSYNFILYAFFIALTLGVLGGIYPAWRASRLSPIEALRYE